MLAHGQLCLGPGLCTVLPGHCTLYHHTAHHISVYCTVYCTLCHHTAQHIIVYCTLYDDTAQHTQCSLHAPSLPPCRPRPPARRPAPGHSGGRRARRRSPAHRPRATGLPPGGTGARWTVCTAHCVHCTLCALCTVHTVHCYKMVYSGVQCSKLCTLYRSLSVAQ